MKQHRITILICYDKEVKRPNSRKTHCYADSNKFFSYDYVAGPETSKVIKNLGAMINVGG